MPTRPVNQQTEKNWVVSVDDPSVIDFVTQSRDGDVVLVMVEGRPWDASAARLAELANKVSVYVSFVSSGEIYSKYPELVGKPIAFELRSIELPDAVTQELIDKMRLRLKRIGIDLMVRQIGASPSE
jgi:hypothetical protein